MRTSMPEAHSGREVDRHRHCHRCPEYGSRLDHDVLRALTSKWRHAVNPLPTQSSIEHSSAGGLPEQSGGRTVGRNALLGPEQFMLSEPHGAQFLE